MVVYVAKVVLMSADVHVHVVYTSKYCMNGDI